MLKCQWQQVQESDVNKPQTVPVGLDQNCPKLTRRLVSTGETETRLTFPDGTGYARTFGAGVWQGAHSHTGFIEVSLVQTGWAAFAYVDKYSHRCLKVCRPGDFFVAEYCQPHNVYLQGIIDCVTSGKVVGNSEKGGADWWPAPHLEEWCQALTPLHIANQGNVPSEFRGVVLQG